MPNREHYLLLDSETTQDARVFDFGAIVCDRKGRIYHQCAVLVAEHIHADLFHINGPDAGHWSRDNMLRKREAYNDMVRDGTRMIASVAAINRWLERACGKYSPILTAYNLAFDADKCQKTGIDLTMFPARFCLWHLAANMFAHRKDYRAFILANHYFNPPTALGNMSYKSNAEVMAHYITGQYADEPHTALEDVIGWELPILKACVNRKGWKKKTTDTYNWEKYQMRDHYRPA